MSKLTDSEGRRLEALRKLMVLDSSPEKAYDDLTRAASELCETPIALVSLIDTDRQWFKSKLGLGVDETAREFAFCAHAIEAPTSVMVVPDATQDPRFMGNPLVTGDPNIRFYAGAPLVTESGDAIGTLCVIDTQPRQLDADKLEMLQFLARQVVEALEHRARRLAG